MAHTRADIQLLSGLLAECKELASDGLHFLERPPPPSLEAGEGPGEEVVPETPPETASTSEAPQASLTYAAAAKGEGVEARALRGLPDRLRGLLVSLKAQHAEADSGLAGVQAELREQREKSSRTSNHKRGPVRAIIAQKKLEEEQRLSYILLQTEYKMADIQSILQQRAKEATQCRRQRALGGRRDMSPGDESSKDSDSNSHHSPGVPCTSALATPGGAAETERKAREKDSEAEWEEEKEKKKTKKKKKNIARRQPETPVRGSGDSKEEGECSPDEYTYNEEAFPALQTPGARDTNPTGGNTCVPQESARPASVEVPGPPTALHGDRETIPAGTMASTGDPMEGPFPSSLPCLPSDLPLHVVAPSGVAGSSASW
ncbi:Hypothetical predicted protein [Pelobates cultripes]|uniref:Uncharacterized protein n=1 Tax=Pelobates cultripes TaxID=61616 RepID=A0AAD1TBJ3_PELCU|nr:Hypothetical predicted protein [Pelobates cultripes]